MVCKQIALHPVIWCQLLSQSGAWECNPGHENEATLWPLGTELPSMCFFPGGRGEICAQQSVVRNEKEVGLLFLFVVGMCVSVRV